MSKESCSGCFVKEDIAAALKDLDFKEASEIEEECDDCPVNTRLIQQVDTWMANNLK